jgi:hypothetical protein
MRILVTLILSISLVTAFAQETVFTDNKTNVTKHVETVGTKSDSLTRAIDSNFVIVDLRDLNKLYTFMGDAIKFPDGVEKTFSANDRDRLFILLNEFVLAPAEKRKRPVYKPGK